MGREHRGESTGGGDLENTPVRSGKHRSITSRYSTFKFFRFSHFTLCIRHQPKTFLSSKVNPTSMLRALIATNRLFASSPFLSCECCPRSNRNQAGEINLMLDAGG